MIQFSGQLVAVKLNAEREGKALAMKYRVSGFPTVLYLDADGGEWGRMPGFMPAPEFLQLAGDALKEFKGQPALEAKLKQNPTDSALAAELTQRLTRQGNETKALWAAGLLTKAPQSSKYASAYIGMGRLYLRKEKGAKARPWFQKALALSTGAEDKAYGHLGLALCYVAERNSKAARAELNALLRVPDAPPGIQEKARSLLEQIPN